LAITEQNRYSNVLWAGGKGGPPVSHKRYPLSGSLGRSKSAGGGINGTQGRPDADGNVTFGEAYGWWKDGGGQSLYQNVGNLDLSRIKASDFPKGVGSKQSFNLDLGKFTNVNNALVYGNISLTLLPGNKVVATSAYDIYNFDMQNWNQKTFIRNMATIGAGMLHGSGDPFIIYLYGTGTIGK